MPKCNTTVVDIEVRKNLPIKDFTGSTEIIVKLCDNQNFSVIINPDENVKAFLVKQHQFLNNIEAYINKA